MEKYENQISQQQYQLFKDKKHRILKSILFKFQLPIRTLAQHKKQDNFIAYSIVNKISNSGWFSNQRLLVLDSRNKELFYLSKIPRQVYLQNNDALIQNLRQSPFLKEKVNLSKSANQIRQIQKEGNVLSIKWEKYFKQNQSSQKKSWMMEMTSTQLVKDWENLIILIKDQKLVDSASQVKKVTITPSKVGQLQKIRSGHSSSKASFTQVQSLKMNSQNLTPTSNVRLIKNVEIHDEKNQSQNHFFKKRSQTDQNNLKKNLIKSSQALQGVQKAKSVKQTFEGRQNNQKLSKQEYRKHQNTREKQEIEIEQRKINFQNKEVKKSQIKQTKSQIKDFKDKGDLQQVNILNESQKKSVQTRSNSQLTEQNLIKDKQREKLYLKYNKANQISTIEELQQEQQDSKNLLSQQLRFLNSKKSQIASQKAIKQVASSQNVQKWPEQKKQSLILSSSSNEKQLQNERQLQNYKKQSYQKQLQSQQDKACPLLPMIDLKDYRQASYYRNTYKIAKQLPLLDPGYDWNEIYFAMLIAYHKSATQYNNVLNYYYSKVSPQGSSGRQNHKLQGSKNAIGNNQSRYINENLLKTRQQIKQTLFKLQKHVQKFELYCCKGVEIIVDKHVLNVEQKPNKQSIITNNNSFNNKRNKKAVKVREQQYKCNSQGHQSYILQQGNQNCKNKQSYCSQIKAIKEIKVVQYQFQGISFVFQLNNYQYQNQQCHQKQSSERKQKQQQLNKSPHYYKLLQQRKFLETFRLNHLHPTFKQIDQSSTINFFHLLTPMITIINYHGINIYCKALFKGSRASLSENNRNEKEKYNEYVSVYLDQDSIEKSKQNLINLNKYIKDKLAKKTVLTYYNVNNVNNDHNKNQIVDKINSVYLCKQFSANNHLVLGEWNEEMLVRQIENRSKDLSHLFFKYMPLLEILQHHFSQQGGINLTNHHDFMAFLQENTNEQSIVGPSNKSMQFLELYAFIQKQLYSNKQYLKVSLNAYQNYLKPQYNYKPQSNYKLQNNSNNSSSQNNTAKLLVKNRNFLHYLMKLLLNSAIASKICEQIKSVMKDLMSQLAIKIKLRKDQNIVLIDPIYDTYSDSSKSASYFHNTSPSKRQTNNHQSKHKQIRDQFKIEIKLKRFPWIIYHFSNHKNNQNNDTQKNIDYYQQLSTVQPFMNIVIPNYRLLNQQQLNDIILNDIIHKALNTIFVSHKQYKQKEQIENKNQNFHNHYYHKNQKTIEFTSIFQDWIQHQLFSQFPQQFYNEIGYIYHGVLDQLKLEEYINPLSEQSKNYETILKRSNKRKDQMQKYLDSPLKKSQAASKQFQLNPNLNNLKKLSMNSNQSSMSNKSSIKSISSMGSNFGVSDNSPSKLFQKQSESVNRRLIYHIPKIFDESQKQLFVQYPFQIVASLRCSYPLKQTKEPPKLKSQFEKIQQLILKKQFNKAIQIYYLLINPQNTQELNTYKNNLQIKKSENNQKYSKYEQISASKDKSSSLMVYSLANQCVGYSFLQLAFNSKQSSHYNNKGQIILYDNKNYKGSSPSQLARSNRQFSSKTKTLLSLNNQNVGTSQQQKQQIQKASNNNISLNNNSKQVQQYLVLTQKYNSLSSWGIEKMYGESDIVRLINGLISGTIKYKQGNYAQSVECFQKAIKGMLLCGEQAPAYKQMQLIVLLIKAQMDVKLGYCHNAVNSANLLADQTALLLAGIDQVNLVQQMSQDRSYYIQNGLAQLLENQLPEFQLLQESYQSFSGATDFNNDTAIDKVSKLKNRLHVYLYKSYELLSSVYLNTAANSLNYKSLNLNYRSVKVNNASNPKIKPPDESTKGSHSNFNSPSNRINQPVNSLNQPNQQQPSSLSLSQKFKQTILQALKTHIQYNNYLYQLIYTTPQDVTNNLISKDNNLLTKYLKILWNIEVKVMGVSRKQMIKQLLLKLINKILKQMKLSKAIAQYSIQSILNPLSKANLAVQYLFVQKLFGKNQILNKQQKYFSFLLEQFHQTQFNEFRSYLTRNLIKFQSKQKSNDKLILEKYDLKYQLFKQLIIFLKFILILGQKQILEVINTNYQSNDSKAIANYY